MKHSTVNTPAWSPRHIVRHARIGVVLSLGVVAAILLGSCSSTDEANGSDAATQTDGDFIIPALPAGVNECSLIDDATVSEILSRDFVSERGGPLSDAVGCTWWNETAGLEFTLQAMTSEDLTPDLVCQHSAQAQPGFEQSELEYVAGALAVWGANSGLILCLEDGSLRFAFDPPTTTQEGFQQFGEGLARAALDGLRDLADS